ncbi:hypothetical protein M422DRAFT_50886 [Sphaerobolus stellatus SS14]|uniref:Uncharacterized protein n=1 Tax=Sphaerobolus stellatus (strain SS14) TaxID=990650 RepID=A0A0C9V4Y9_SPHS4|nr:hypothetical protein M422DRAFT_50886 [Sphaerobolus stellatus SS14]
MGTNLRPRHPILVDLAIVYGATNVESVSEIFKQAFQVDQALSKTFQNDVLLVLTARLADAQTKSAATTRKTAYIASQLSKCGPSVVRIFAGNTSLIKNLAQCYQTGVDRPSNSGQGDNKAKKQWLYTKAYIIDIFHSILSTYIQSEKDQDYESLFNILFALTEVPSTSAAVSKKEKILSKHEFAGNKAHPIGENDNAESGPSGSRGDGRGRGRGGGGGGGGGRGGGRGGGGSGDAARDRSWKDKNKARQANQNRKRGHDKKMARAGPPPA